jgi:CubicO group peptidase (beta-lactamase class C family)
MDSFNKALAPEQTPTSDTPLTQAIEFHKYFNAPENRVKIQFPSPESLYAWQHLSQYYPTARAARGGAISQLEVSIDESIGDIKFTGKDGVERTVSQHFEDMPLDAMLVLKDGKIVHERYKTMTPDTAHITMSASKVFSSTLLAMFEDEGKVDLSKPVSDYVPELKGSVWDTVLLRHVADMQTGLNATEHDEPTQDSRTNPDEPFYRWMSTLGLVPNTTGNDDPFAVMRTMERRKPGGEVFEYSSMNPFLLSRIIEKIENRPIADVFRDRIWSKIGAEHDATFVISPQGYALDYGFTTITLRDFARVGSIFTPSARSVTGASILSADTVKRIQAAGNPGAYAGGYVGGMMTPKFGDDAGKISNAYMWDAIMSDGDMFKGGVGGQGLYVSPSRDMVAVWFTTGDGTEWNESMGRAIALSFD